MARKSRKKTVSDRDWKDRFVFVGLSVVDEREAKEYLSGLAGDVTAELLSTVTDNGGSIKVKPSKQNGSIFVTLSLDDLDENYGGYFFGLSYPTVEGAVRLAYWFLHKRLSDESGMKYLPSDMDSWLD